MSGEPDWIDDFSDDDHQVEVEIEQPKQEEVESSGRARGPDGKFVKAEAERQAEEVEKGAKEAAEADVNEPPSYDEETGTVPIHVLKALRKELQDLKAKTNGQQGQTQPRAPEFNGPSVDFDDDPAEHLQQSMQSMKMQMSTFMAAQQNDEQTVSEAWTAFDQACQSDPEASALSFRLLNHPHPMAEVVKWYKQGQEVRMLREAGGVEALVAKRMAELGYQAPAQAGSPAARANVPPSLAGTGKRRATESLSDDDDGFDALFKK
jgi:hypothetical protein